jgi:L-rhamnose mutarotase
MTMWEDILSMKIAKDMQYYTIYLTSKQAGSTRYIHMREKKEKKRDIFKPTKIKMK